MFVLLMGAPDLLFPILYTTKAVKDDTTDMHTQSLGNVKYSGSQFQH